jgi:hypothetical protein
LFNANLDAPMAQAEAWIEKNVPHNARLAVDDALWVDLVHAGFPRQNVVWYYKVDTDPAVEQLAPNGWRDYDYLVSTQSVRSDPKAAPQVAQALRNSTPYAVFGGGDSRVEVRRIASSGWAILNTAKRNDIAGRRRTADDLLANRQLRMSAATRQVLRNGALDIRAATALAIMCGMSTVTVSGLPADIGEEAAGMPVRVVDVADLSPSAVTVALAGLPPGFRPLTMSSLGTAGTRLVWNVAVAPVVLG